MCNIFLSLVNYPKLKSQILLTNCPNLNSTKSFNDSNLFWLNQEFGVIKNDKLQARGRVNLIGRLQLNQDSLVEESHSEIIRLRVYRIQEAIVKIMKTRQRIHQAQLHTELIEVLKNMFLPSKRLIKEQIEWLIEHKFLERDPKDINIYVYVT